MSKPQAQKKCPVVKSEEQIPQAIDRCIADGLIKTGSGMIVGAALSLILFRRRIWPITLGTGIGIGMSLSNCQTNLNCTDVVKRNENCKET